MFTITAPSTSITTAGSSRCSRPRCKSHRRAGRPPAGVCLLGWQPELSIRAHQPTVGVGSAGCGFSSAASVRTCGDFGGRSHG